MLTPFMLLGMWFSFLVGAGTHAIIDEHQKKPVDNVTIYRIGVDYGGNTKTQCIEYQGPAVESLTRGPEIE